MPPLLGAAKIALIFELQKKMITFFTALSEMLRDAFLLLSLWQVNFAHFWEYLSLLGFFFEIKAYNIRKMLYICALLLLILRDKAI
ncbi:MAG: hypothetical protein LBJ57_07485 [Prevotellaceae bacterium]|jgi:hypothetical protein|nr:hypothetical protein [Prevotellaceae bacterium]